MNRRLLVVGIASMGAGHIAAAVDWDAYTSHLGIKDAWSYAFDIRMPTMRRMRQRWIAVQANAWYAAEPWPVGTNFVPSTAINQLEM